MNLLSMLKLELLQVVKKTLNLSDEDMARVDIALNVDKDKTFGDMSCNAAMMLAKQLEKNPRQLAQEIQQAIIFASQQNEENPLIFGAIKSVEIAGPGFLNITLNHEVWWTLALEFFQQKDMFFQLEFDEENKQKYLIEFVSANPTGPLHLGHGRGAIIGDTLARVLNFLGHSAEKEFYINDAGNQLAILGNSLKIRCLQQCGQSVELPENGYAGEYMIELAKECINELGRDVINNDEAFFADYAKEKMLALQKKDLENYRVIFDNENNIVFVYQIKHRKDIYND